MLNKTPETIGTRINADDADQTGKDTTLNAFLPLKSAFIRFDPRPIKVLWSYSAAPKGSLFPRVVAEKA
jgi:hypothetical protein